MTRLDGALAAVAFAFACLFWVTCLGVGEASGDAFMPIECGWHSLRQWRPIQPAQPIYGYGVCIGGAGLLAFASDMLDVTRNRAIAGAAATPLVFLAVRLAAPALLGVSVPAARAGAVTAAALMARHPSLIASHIEGKHGYLALTWISLALLAAAVATTRRAPLALAVAAVALPMAVMNHPFSLWVATAALALLPLMHARSGTRPVLGALLLGALVLLPRLAPMWMDLGSSGDLDLLTQPDVGFDEALAGTWAGLAGPAHGIVALGLVVLAAGVGARRPAEHEGTPLAVPAIAWGAAAIAATGTLVATAWLLGFVRAYHVQLIAPLGALGVGVAAAALVERMLQISGHPAVAVVLGGALAWGTADLAAGTDDLFDRTCLDVPPSALSAAGSAAIQEAVAADAEGGVIVSDLYLGVARIDTAVPVSLGLHRAGIRATAPRTWYWIVGGEDEALKRRIASAPGVRTVLGPPTIRDHLVTADRPEGLRTALCSEGLDPSAYWTGSYRTWLAWMDAATDSSTLVPPDPLDCGIEQAGPEFPVEDVVTGLRGTLADAPFVWVRGPEDIPGSLAGRTVILQVFDCLDTQLAAGVDWLSLIEPRELRRGSAVLSILLSPQPEFRTPDGDRLCGLRHGSERTLGIALDGSLKLDLKLGATPRTLIFDRSGRLRGSFEESISEGTPPSLRALELLDRLYAEDQRWRLDSGPVPR